MADEGLVVETVDENGDVIPEAATGSSSDQKHIVAVISQNPHDNGLEDKESYDASYQNQVMKSLGRIQDLLEEAHKKVEGLKLDLIVFPEWTCGLSQSMDRWDKSVHNRDLKRDIYDDIHKVYDYQMDFVKNEICKKYGCSAVLNVLGTDEAKYHVTDQYRIYTQSIYFDNDGEILTKYNKMSCELAFVDDGHEDQCSIVTLKANGQKDGTRKVALAISRDLIGFLKFPRHNIMKTLFPNFKVDSKVAPIVAVPNAVPPIFVQKNIAKKMRSWAELPGDCDATYNNLVVASANQTGDSFIVDQNGELMWFSESEASTLERGDCELQKSRIFWRTV